MATVAVVLGAGGVVGMAYHAGVLAALAEGAAWDPRSADVVVGTSAGSVTGSLLRAGFSAADLAARATGDPVSEEARELLSRRRSEAPARAWTGRPARFGFGSTALLRQAIRRPGSVRIGAAIAAALPEGRLPTETFAAGLRDVLGDAWPDRPTWICAVRLDDGARVVFGAAGTPPAAWPDAVAASCAIPSVFRPVEIGGRRYVDGGAHSTTNLDTLVAERVDLVIVSAPMGLGEPGPALDLPLRAAVEARLGREVAAVRASGATVVVLRPTAADRRAMGLRPMDPDRREPVARQARASALEWLRRPANRRLLELGLSG